MNTRKLLISTAFMLCLSTNINAQQSVSISNPPVELQTAHTADEIQSAMRNYRIKQLIWNYKKMDIVIFPTLFLSLVKILQKMKYLRLKQQYIMLFWK